MNERVAEFQKELQEAKFDAFFVTNITNSYYFTKFLSHSYVYLIVYAEDTPQFFVPELEYEEAASIVKNCEVVENRVDKAVEKFKSGKRLTLEEFTLLVKSGML